jgi:hypothetical protein
VCCVPRFNSMSIAMRKLLTFLIALAITVDCSLSKMCVDLAWLISPLALRLILSDAYNKRPPEASKALGLGH